MKSAMFAVVAVMASAHVSSAQAPNAQTPPAPKAYLGGSPRVSPDGARILFASDRSGKSQLYSMKPDGSDVRQLTTDSTGTFGGSWSPDGRRIVFETRDPNGPGRIVVMNADGTSRHVVDEATSNQSPSWSPDGSKILFASGTFPNINIYSINTDGTDRKNISPNPGFDYDPLWSPDGTMIAFVVGTRGLGPRVHVMNADGSGRRRLTTLDLGEERPTWSPDGKQLAFQASGSSGGAPEANVYVVDVQSGTTRRVTNHRRPQLDETPSWFPDGQRLAIQSDRDGTWSIFVIGLDGAVKDRLTKSANYYNARWSPDGRTLVFESTRDGKFAIYTVAVDGSRLTKLTGDGYNSGQPNWSPDGKRIVHSSNRDGSGELYIMNADGSNPRRITNTPPGGGQYGSSFSPDGRWIVFQGRSNNALINENVYVVRPDGTGRRQLTDSTMNSVGPRWTKDGQITFTQSRYGVRLWSEMNPTEMERGKATEQIVTVRPDGSEVTRSPKKKDQDCCESWMRDWSTVFFKSARDGSTAVYAMNADGSNIRRIADASVIPEVNVSPDGRLFAYTRNSGDTWGAYVYDIATGRERAVAGGRVQPVGR